MRGDNLFRASDGRDTVAELARTSGRADPENAPTNNPHGEEGASHYDQSPPLAPADYPSAPEQAYERDEPRHDDTPSERPYDQDRGHDVNYDTEEYAIEPRLIRLVLMVAIFGLAVAGTGVAFGYRAMFGSSTSLPPPPIIHPTKGSKEIVHASSDAQPTHNGSASQGGAATTGSIENLVSHEQLDGGSLTGMGTPAAAVPSTAGQAMSNRAMPVGVEEGADSPWPPSAPQRSPERVVEPGRSHVAALTPASLNSIPAVPPRVSGGGYTVQVTAERSESKARAEFRKLQAKYRNQLSGRHAIIRRANLGTRGTYYRALVGPFASAQEAELWCSGLIAAGGHCVVQPN